MSDNIADLVARLQSHEGIGAALASDRGQTSRYVCAIMDEAAQALTRIAGERDEARRVAAEPGSAYAYALHHAERADAAEARALSAEGERDRLREALEASVIAMGPEVETRGDDDVAYPFPMRPALRRAREALGETK